MPLPLTARTAALGSRRRRRAPPTTSTATALPVQLPARRTACCGSSSGTLARRHRPAPLGIDERRRRPRAPGASVPGRDAENAAPGPIVSARPAPAGRARRRATSLSASAERGLEPDDAERRLVELDVLLVARGAARGRSRSRRSCRRRAPARSAATSAARAERRRHLRVACRSSRHRLLGEREVMRRRLGA